MRREIAAWFLVALALALLFGFVWLTWRPEDPFFDRVAEWPVVGAPVERVRRIYLPPTRRASPGAQPTSPGGRAAEPPLASEDPEWVFVGVGAAFREQPRSDAPLVARTTRLDQYRVLERREPTAWVLIAESGGREVWVDLDAPRDRTPPLGEEPLPGGPLPARSADPAVLALADALMTGETTERSAGGYRLRTDVRDPLLLNRLAGELEGLESIYARRYGVEPIGRPAETLVLFAHEGPYRSFESRVPELRGVGSTGHAVGGVAALYVGDRPDREVLSTAVHEVTHLLNRRALGPALPPWLEEGLADEMSLLGRARAVGSGSPFEGSIDLEGTTIRGRGPLAGLALLLDSVDRGEAIRLESLLEQDWQSFRVAPSGRELYNQSGFFLHYLLEREERPELAAGLRAFLDRVSRGEPPTGQELVSSLGVGWDEIERDFLAWLAEEGEAAGAGLLRRRRPDPDTDGEAGAEAHDQESRHTGPG